MNNIEKKIRIFAPATVSNVGSGFDIMGFAIEGTGDTIEMELRNDSLFIIENSTGVALPGDPEENVITPVIKALQKELGIDVGVTIRFINKIKPGSGIGSSAASSVAVAYGFNRLLGKPLIKKELIRYAMEGERMVSGTGHADNIAPCMLGGFVLIRSYRPLDIIEIPYPRSIYGSVVLPDISIMTSVGRSVIQKSHSLKKTITQTGNAAGLVAGLIMGDFELIGRSMVDVIAEPKRKNMIPGFDEVRQAAMDAGALGCNISGSGPAVFALSKDAATARKAGNAMVRAFNKNKLGCKLFLSPISKRGVSEI
ncbi:MAG TPA: homoserine kinase [Bacteroidetes bacterium]|nr:homoserine kinase [Bacteroidota bacterium]